MAITYKDFKKIEFPAFRLPSDNWESRDGLLYVDGQVVDDRNMPGKTLGLRRLQSPFQSLLPLHKAYPDPLALIKDSSGPYIDSAGKLFEYQKTEYTRLKYLKIKKIDKCTTHSLLWLYELHFPIKIPRPPGPEYPWAGILYLKGLPWKLYEYSRVKLPETRRKV